MTEEEGQGKRAIKRPAINGGFQPLEANGMKIRNRISYHSSLATVVSSLS